MAGQDAWRILTRLTVVPLGLAVLFGILALAALMVLGGMGVTAGALAARTAWRVATILGVAQLAGLLGAVLGGVPYVRMLRGADPVPLVAPTRTRIRTLGTASLVLAVLAALAWLVLDPARWLSTLALGLVAAQCGLALRVLGGAHRRFLGLERRR